MRLLKVLGHASDALSLMDATSRELAVTEAQREIARRISNHEDAIERLRRERDQIQDLLDERVVWMRQHFKAFAVHRCHGNAFNSYRFTPVIAHAPFAELTKWMLPHGGLARRHVRMGLGGAIELVHAGRAQETAVFVKKP
jgi:hypothetical protein